jgi:phosphoglycerate kinase
LQTYFLWLKVIKIGLSKVEKEAVSTARQLERNFKKKILLPLDVVVVNEKMDMDSIRCCPPHEVKKKEMILDAGPKTILAYAKELKLAKTILWNGPLGYFEKKPFDTATFSLSRIIGAVAGRKAFAVVGGGETVDVVRKSHQFEHIDHVSTGGGAMLEYLAGKKLPGIEALK